MKDIWNKINTDGATFLASISNQIFTGKDLDEMIETFPAKERKTPLEAGDPLEIYSIFKSPLSEYAYDFYCLLLAISGREVQCRDHTGMRSIGFTYNPKSRYLQILINSNPGIFLHPVHADFKVVSNGKVKIYHATVSEPAEEVYDYDEEMNGLIFDEMDDVLAYDIEEKYAQPTKTYSPEEYAQQRNELAKRAGAVPAVIDVSKFLA